MSSQYQISSNVVIDGAELPASVLGLVNEFFHEVSTTDNRNSYSFDCTKLPTAQHLFAVDQVDFQKLTIALTGLAYWANSNVENYNGEHLYGSLRRLVDMLLVFYRHKHCQNLDTLLSLVQLCEPIISQERDRLSKSLLSALEKFKNKQALNQEIYQGIRKISDGYTEKLDIYSTKASIQLRDRWKNLLVDLEESAKLPFDVYEFNLDNMGFKWSKKIDEQIVNLSNEQKKAWFALWHCAATAKGAKPSQTWDKKAKEYIDVLQESFSIMSAQWLRFILDDVSKIYIPFSDSDALVLKGFLWCCALGEPKVLASVIGELVEFCYVKLSGIGARSPALANAGLYALGCLGLEGVLQLSKLRSSVKYDSSLRLIEKSLTEAAQRQKMTQDELEDLSVPQFNFDQNAQKEMYLSGYKAVFFINEQCKPELSWYDSNSKMLKTIPADIKKNHASTLKIYKKELLEIDSVISAQLYRLENNLVLQKAWSYSTWYQRLVQHPVLAVLVEKFVWLFTGDKYNQSVMFFDNQFVDSKGNVVTELPNDISVKLWHPIFSSLQQLIQWRDFFNRRCIVQPFEQIEREIYLPEDELITTDDRFGRCLVKQDKLADICRKLRWHYRVQGDWDGLNSPMRTIEKSDVTAWLRFDYQDETITNMKSTTGVYQYLRIEHVEFSKPISQVPALIFSELMRDVKQIIQFCVVDIE